MRLYRFAESILFDDSISEDRSRSAERFKGIRDRREGETRMAGSRGKPGECDELHERDRLSGKNEKRDRITRYNSYVDS